MGMRRQAGSHPLRDGRCDPRGRRRGIPPGRAQAADQDTVREPRNDGGHRDMKVAEMRDKSLDELQIREKELSEQLFKLRFQRATGRIENPMKIREVKREIARIKTLLGERSRA